MTTTEPTDLRERIARTLSEHWHGMHTNEALGQQRMLADAVLPIVREVQKRAWDECAQEQGTWPRPKGDPRALTFILLANNPYRDEESTNDES